MIKSFLFPVLLCLCAAGAFAADVETYSSKEHDFTLQYPGTWEKKERASGSAVAVLAPKDAKTTFRANVNVIEQDIPKDADLKAFSSLSLSVMDKLLKGYKEVDRQDISIGTLKAVRVVYTYTFEDYDLKSVLVLAVSGKHGYAITCAAESDKFDTFKADFDKMVNSFKPL